MILYGLAQFWQSSYKSHLIVRINFIISIVLNLLLWGGLYYKLQPFSYLTEYGSIPLHYNLYFGIDLLGKWYAIFVLPLFGLLVIIINNLIAYLLFNRERLLSYFLLVTQTLVNVALFAAGIFIILLNI